MTKEFLRPNVTADMLIPNERGEFLLIRRKNYPFEGQFAIPGGFLEVNEETVEQCAIREAEEETGLKVEIDRLVGVYSHPKRDPRWHNVTAVYLSRPLTMDQAQKALAGDDAGEVLWIHPESKEFEQMELAFDHRQIINDALRLIQEKSFF